MKSPRPGIDISNRTRIFEITAVALTGFGKFIFVDVLALKFWYILIACLFWLLYILIQFWKKKIILMYWGFRRENLWIVFLILLPLLITGFVAFFVIGYYRNTLILNWHILPVLVLYPVWGIIQQFLIVALVGGNLADLKGHKLPRIVVVLATSIVFSVVHYPSLQLLLATFFLALLYTNIYLTYRNLWPLGISHGWLGCFFYFFILHRDPWAEAIQTL